MLNNNIPHSPTVAAAECEFHEAQSAIDFCPIHPLSWRKMREKNCESEGEREAKQANSPLNNISTHIHTARAVFCADIPMENFGKVGRGRGCRIFHPQNFFSPHEKFPFLCFLFFSGFLFHRGKKRKIGEVKVLIFHPINHVNKI
jgi:hypothetical protein